ncbi:Glycogen phosphorylase [Fasciolopsis buskii]|uniref:Alpha-1,4 glucan phosphorylase n=1 Tax=Fasciolopsis buskii TaxID=27845 RepID=A0A8E0VJN1_9TREM|nr:Glycogen phosphorylase [Fasciolopsis buski]
MSSDRRSQISISDVALIESVKNLKESFNTHLHFDVVKDRNVATLRDFYMALAHTVWERISSRWIRTQQFERTHVPKRIYFLSMEFCMGRTLSNTMLSVNITDALDEAMYQLGLDIEDLEDIECDAGLGNGGLGRLAACFLDSMATLRLSVTGQGIRYEHGSFEQGIENGWQTEELDEWLRFGNPWEIERSEYSQMVHFGGRMVKDEHGQPQWRDTEVVTATPYDTPIPGYRNNVCNTLRLWAAKAGKTFDLNTFFAGDYINAVLARNHAENISRVLYPIDHVYEGKQLRLRQEYFLVCASLKDMLRQFKQDNPKSDLFELPYRVAVHLNDTHPALAIPELMRILMDEHKFMWRDAWDICYQTFTHTNHVARPEALKHWSVDMLKRMLPRHMEIIEKINKHLSIIINRRWPNDPTHFQRMSIIRYTDRPVVSMDNLCIVGSHQVNGVSVAQTNYLRTVLFKDFTELWPRKILNKTNGISPRRWLLLCNPGLADLIMDAMQGDESWITNLSMINRLRDHLDEPKLRLDIMRVKLDNKNRFASYMLSRQKIHLDPSTLFDVMVKRVDEYKRHLLCCLHVMTLYNRIKANPRSQCCPRTVIMGGKAAPGYYMAKLIIKLINSVAKSINCDPVVNGRLKLVYLKNYGVSLAERVIPAADLSEQIPCMGMEAAGTGNMKFMLNGALTICTLDGVNAEIVEEVGRENAFVFGRSIEEDNALRAKGYDPRKWIAANPELAHCLEQIRSGYYNPAEPDLFQDIYRSLVTEDRFLICADYEDYMRAQAEVEYAYSNEARWSRMVLCNIAGAGRFSSDRTVAEYAREMWNVDPSESKLPPPSEPLEPKLPKFYIGI